MDSYQDIAKKLDFYDYKMEEVETYIAFSKLRISELSRSQDLFLRLKINNNNFSLYEKFCLYRDYKNKRLEDSINILYDFGLYDYFQVYYSNLLEQEIEIDLICLIQALWAGEYRLYYLEKDNILLKKLLEEESDEYIIHEFLTIDNNKCIITVKMLKEILVKLISQEYTHFRNL